MNIMNINVVLIIIILHSTESSIFKSKFNKIKESAKQFYRNNLARNKTWQFLGDDPTLYPGTNTKYRQENEKTWDKYYECLHKQEQSIGKHGHLIPEAVQGFEGGLIKFDCNLCLSPREQTDIENVEWYYGKIGNHYLELILYDEHVMLTPEDRALHIYNLKTEHSGQYVCILGDSVTVPYYLTVVNGSSQLSEVHPPSWKSGTYPAEPVTIPEHKLVLDTAWSDWSPCSKCDNVGKRYKLGYCVVIYDENASSNKRSFPTFKQLFLDENYTLSFKKHKKKEETNITVLNIHLELIKIFEFGIPCKSHILPESIKRLPTVQNRSDEMMVGYCKVPCKGQDIFELRDKNGNVIERANNSAGIYSLVQGIPPVVPSIERQLQYETLGKDIVLTCPGNLNTDAPIKWQINSINIIPELIHDASHGRIYISLLDKIHIKKALIDDSNLYSCWQNNQLAGTIRLVVEKKISLTFNHYIMLFGMILILFTFIYVFIRAFMGRKHAKRARI